MIGLEKSFQMMYSNIGLNSLETAPLNMQYRNYKIANLLPKVEILSASAALYMQNINYFLLFLAIL